MKSPDPARGGQRGSTLVVVAVLLLIFLLAVSLLAAKVLSNARMVRDAAARQQSFLLADSGIRVLSERLAARRERTGGAVPNRLRVEGELAGGSFEAVAVRLDVPGIHRDLEPRFVVTARGRFAGSTTVLSSRAELWEDGLRQQAVHFGTPPEDWFDMEADETLPSDDDDAPPRGGGVPGGPSVQGRP